MGPKPWAIRVVVILSKAAVIGMIALVIGGLAQNAYRREIAEAEMRAETARTAKEWREAVHKWHEGAAIRRRAQAEMDQIRTEAMAAQQKQGRNAR